MYLKCRPPRRLSDDQLELSMHRGKLRNLLTKFEEYLIVDHGLAATTVEGYTRSLSIALRRMRIFCPTIRDIKRHILWMHSEKYSYNHIVNTSLAIEHYCRQRGFIIRLGRPRKPKRVIKDTLSESEISRIIQATKNSREKAMICLLAFSGIRNREICNLRVDDVDLGSNRGASLIMIRDQLGHAFIGMSKA